MPGFSPGSFSPIFEFGESGFSEGGTGNFSGGSFSGEVGGFSADGGASEGLSEQSIIVGGGVPHDQPLQTRRQISEARKRLGLEDGYRESERALPVINFVAARQAERLETDQQKIFDELLRELELERITFERRYLEALNLERQRLITEEIARRLRAKIADEELMLLMLVAAAV